jgi:hypothetical protein
MLSLLAQTPESKKEEFRKYLEKSGVIDALTKVLVGLYEEPERPANAVDYIKRYMGAPTGVDVEASTTNRWRSVYHLKRTDAVLYWLFACMFSSCCDLSGLSSCLSLNQTRVPVALHRRRTSSAHSCLPFAASCTGNQTAE